VGQPVSPHRRGHRGPDGVVERVDYSPAVARGPLSQPTTLLEKASRTLASHNTPSRVRLRVMSATYIWFGLVAVKSRPGRSGAAACRGFCRVDTRFQPPYAARSRSRPECQRPAVRDRPRSHAHH
jgi:hypothetical protein